MRHHRRFSGFLNSAPSFASVKSEKIESGTSQYRNWYVIGSNLTGEDESYISLRLWWFERIIGFPCHFINLVKTKFLTTNSFINKTWYILQDLKMQQLLPRLLYQHSSRFIQGSEKSAVYLANACLPSWMAGRISGSVRTFATMEERAFAKQLEEEQKARLR